MSEQLSELYPVALEMGILAETFWNLSVNEIWVKYADSPTSGMSDNPSGKKYIGFAYNKTTGTESTSYSDYSWSLIKGEKGDKGSIGDTGAQGATGNGIKSITCLHLE